jgi:PLP dependent protein
MIAPDEIARRLEEVRERIASAAKRAARNPDSIRLILASKTQPVEAIRATYAAGAREFGENYTQEGARKREQLRDLDNATWHLIGHLQSNKAKLAMRTFDFIQTLDSVRLATALALVQPPPATVRILVEVNLGSEAGKAGVAPSEVESLIDSARHNVEIAGLMTIPPHMDGTKSARKYFSQLRELRDRLAAASGIALSELSMGMTEDFEMAVEEGATMVRIGRAVFGERTV